MDIEFSLTSLDVPNTGLLIDLTEVDHSLHSYPIVWQLVMEEALSLHRCSH